MSSLKQKILLLVLILPAIALADQQVLNPGSGPNTGTGDPLRTVLIKSNSNFTELYASVDQLIADIASLTSSKQSVDAELSALAGLSSAADRLPYFTGSGSATLATFTSFGRSLIDDADAATARATTGAAPLTPTFITQTTNSELSGEQALANLSTGLLKNTTSTGVLTIGAAGTDYYAPGSTDVAFADGGTGVSSASDDTVLVSSGSAWVAKSIPDCDATGSILNYDTTTNAFSCATAPFDLSLMQTGAPESDAVMLRYEFVRAALFADDFASSRGIAAVAATASTVLTIKKNGSTIGTATFAIGGTTPTFLTSGGSTSFAAGDIVTVVAPSSPDATLADIAITLLGSR